MSGDAILLGGGYSWRSGDPSVAEPGWIPAPVVANPVLGLSLATLATGPLGLGSPDDSLGQLVLPRGVAIDGSAVLVDLEKARYSHAALDLAHATLYTSTTWDVDVHAELTLDEIAGSYDVWAAQIDDAASERRWWLPLRAAMWLWSVSWCAKWRVLSGRAARADAHGEDWSQDLSDAALVAHVRDRVDCYLSAPVIERIVDEFAALQSRWQNE